MPPYLRWYDANAIYDFHYETKGHSTENYLALKHKVQALMKARYVSFDYNEIGDPIVTSNPLPNHPRPKINALVEDLVERVETYINDVKTLMRVIHEALVQAKFFQPK